MENNDACTLTIEVDSSSLDRALALCEQVKAAALEAEAAISKLTAKPVAATSLPVGTIDVTGFMDNERRLVHLPICPPFTTESTKAALAAAKNWVSEVEFSLAIGVHPTSPVDELISAVSAFADERSLPPQT